jgi:hypothetical protein
MADNLGDFLGNLGLNLDDPCQSTGDPFPWWCFFGCMGVSCHGATNSLNWCNGAPCYGGAANLRPQPRPPEPYCLQGSCDRGSLNFNVG